MIDRTARVQMAKALRSYMDEEITAFAFDQALSEANPSPKDKTARMIADLLWFHYDDCADHKIVASKQEWDFFNRLLLLLESDGEIETIGASRNWPPSRVAAALLFLAFVFLAIRGGWSGYLMAYAVPFGPPSMLLAWLNARRLRKQTFPAESALIPFPSVGSLLALRRRVPGFRRSRYPKAIADRQIRSPLFAKLMWLPQLMAWCMFAPLVLLVQMLPETHTETRISMPEPST
jgi:hypothetical protein